MKNDDVIRDFSEIDESMMKYWVYHGMNYTLYRIAHVGKDQVSAVRMASPKHPATSEPIFKTYLKGSIRKVSQTVGIYETVQA